MSAYLLLIALLTTSAADGQIRAVIKAGQAVRLAKAARAAREAAVAAKAARAAQAARAARTAAIPVGAVLVARSEALAEVANVFRSAATTERAAGATLRADTYERLATLLEAKPVARNLDEAARLAETVAAESATAEAASDFRKLAEDLRSQPADDLRAKPANEPQRPTSIPPEQKQIFKSLASVSQSMPRVRLVRAEVKRFVNDFAAGAQNSAKYLTDRWVGNKPLLSRWQAAPKHRRVFVAGASQDRALIAAWAQQMESDGFVIFFYEFCRQPSGGLCASEVVGAFFWDAATAILADTPMAAKSRYISYEVAAALRLMRGESMFLMITPSELWGGISTMSNAGTTTIQGVAMASAPRGPDGNPRTAPAPSAPLRTKR